MFFWGKFRWIGILKCGDNILDINGLEYVWNDLKLEVPRNVNNIVLQNSGNLIQGWQNCNIQQSQVNTELKNCTIELGTIKINLQEVKDENFWLKYVYPALASIILSLFSYLVINPFSKKKKRLLWLIICMAVFLAISYIISFLIIGIV
ncbi:hypothetical protein HYX00_04450 [Candidatus Woesearchaeota archaeon]|nr:hypothetical protein [Candidatus Woesearchaeota archaeon]